MNWEIMVCLLRGMGDVPGGVGLAVARNMERAMAPAVVQVRKVSGNRRSE
jgi:hypothetical protein